MAIIVNDNFKISAPKPVDQRYGPWNSIPDATNINNIPLTERYKGLTVGVINNNSILEYWWKDGVTNLDLILKTSGGGNGSFTGLTGSPYDNANLTLILNNKADLIDGKINTNQLPDSILTGLKFKGYYNINTNIITSSDTNINNNPLPTSSSTSGVTYNQGWFFVITPSGGTYSSITYKTGDYIVSLGSIGWNKIDNSNNITSTDDLTQGTINLYFTDSKAKTAIFQPGNFVGSEGVIVALTGNSATFKTKFNSSISDSVGSVGVGGIMAGTPASVFKGLNLVQVLENLLFPDVLPTYTIPTVSLTITSGSEGIKEIGSTASISYLLSAIKNDADIFTDLRIYKNSTPLGVSSISPTLTTSMSDQFGYISPNNPNYEYSVVYNETLIIPVGTVTYKGQGDYNAGLTKKNNKGINDSRALAVRNINSPQLGSINFDSNLISVNGIYPFFYGVINSQPTSSSISAIINGGGGVKNLVSSVGNININFGASGQYIWFAIPSASTSKTKWYVDALNSGNIGGTTNLFGTEIIQAVISPDAFWTSINFKVYISNYPTSTSGIMQMQN